MMDFIRKNTEYNIKILQYSPYTIYNCNADHKIKENIII